MANGLLRRGLQCHAENIRRSARVVCAGSEARSRFRLEAPARLVQRRLDRVCRLSFAMDPESSSTAPPSPLAPQRSLITSRDETHAAVLRTIEVAQRRVLCLHADLSLFDLSRTDVVDMFGKFCWLIAARGLDCWLTIPFGSTRVRRDCALCSNDFRWRSKCALPRLMTPLATMQC